MRGLKRLLKLSARMTACKTSSSSSISLSADCLEVINYLSGKREIKTDRILQMYIRKLDQKFCKIYFKKMIL